MKSREEIYDYDIESEGRLSMYKLLKVLRDGIDKTESKDITEEEKKELKRSLDSMLEIFDRLEMRRSQPK